MFSSFSLWWQNLVVSSKRVDPVGPIKWWPGTDPLHGSGGNWRL